MVRQTMELSGEWTFLLDPEDRYGLTESGVHTALPPFNAAVDKIRVPGSWEEQGYGERTGHEPIGSWKKIREYSGAAWYSRVVDIPGAWEDCRIVLRLDGVRWQSAIWVDDEYAGSGDSLLCPHQVDLTPYLRPGQMQRISIRLDNRLMLPLLEESHIHSYYTATNWGGITGGVELEAVHTSAIHSVNISTNVRDSSVAVQVSFEQPWTPGVNRRLQLEVRHPDGSVSASSHVPMERGAVRGNCTMMVTEGVLPWSDRSPSLYSLAARVEEEGIVLDEHICRFGFRELRTEGHQLLINDHPVYLRGYVDCCIFPLTGYPSWDIEHYRRQFRIAKCYGFNHVRLHGWTAPKPFWHAADEEGMLVQAELPNWSLLYRERGTPPDGETHRYLREEMLRLLAHLQEHPSFVMFSMGNELVKANGHPYLNELVIEARRIDPTRLFTDNTGFGELPAFDREGDFFTPSLNWHPPHLIDYASRPDTTEDYSLVARLEQRPLIAHEHGQFTMYVRPGEAIKYTGVLKPHWLETTMDTLRAKGLVDRVDEYIRHTGVLLVRAYKEAIERCRRTAGFAGFQLLDIRDFPGQGHATTGILDVFWDSKGLIEPERYKEFNGETVLLMRSSERTAFAGDVIPVRLDCSHYGHSSLPPGTLSWRLTDGKGKEVSKGRTATGEIVPGNVVFLAYVQLQTEVARSQELTLRVELAAGSLRIGNEWPFWTFNRPIQHERIHQIWSNKNELKPSFFGADFRDRIGSRWLSLGHQEQVELAVVDQLTRDVLQFLLDGGKVWLMAQPGCLHDEVKTRFCPIFWNYIWFPGQEGTTMGMIVHPHPSLGRFPHDGTSNWQWYHLVDGVPAIGLDSVPHIKPFVEVIDNFNRAKRLSYAFEACVGKGKLMVSTFQLTGEVHSKNPEAQFLLQEMTGYLMGSQFQPDNRLTVGELLGLFKIRAMQKR